MFTHSKTRHPRRAAILVARAALVLTIVVPQMPLPAQGLPQPGGASRSAPSQLDSLIADALSASAMLRAEGARTRAARSRVAPAGAHPDPMLMAGVRNVPVTTPGLAGDDMTMSMLGIAQTIPYPGKLGLRTRVAKAEARVADARHEEARLVVTRQVTVAYYTLAATRLVLDVVARQQQLAVALSPAVEARYTAGTASQADLVTTRSEIALLAQEGAAVAEDARAAIGALDALLDRPWDGAIDARFPDRILRAALGDSARPTPFVSAVLGARLDDSPLLPVDSIVALAVQRNPRVREHEALIAAQAASAQLAARDQLPDINVSVEYGYRVGRPDMVSAVIAVPLPLQLSRKQRQLTAAARADLEAHEADHHAEITTLRREVARLTSALERSRAQLALSRRAVLPQVNGAAVSALATYRAGRSEFTTVLTAMRSAYAAESQDIRTLQEFAITLAELEELAGGEVLR